MNSSPTGKLVIHNIKMLRNNPQVYISVHIATDFTWEAKLCGKLLHHDSQLLHNMPQFVSGATEVGNLLNNLEIAKVCTGNEDARFITLAASRGGKFLSQASKYMHACVYIHASNTCD